MADIRGEFAIKYHKPAARNCGQTGAGRESWGGGRPLSPRHYGCGLGSRKPKRTIGRGRDGGKTRVRWMKTIRPQLHFPINHAVFLAFGACVLRKREGQEIRRVAESRGKSTGLRELHGVRM